MVVSNENEHRIELIWTNWKRTIKEAHEMDYDDTNCIDDRGVIVAQLCVIYTKTVWIDANRSIKSFTFAW